MLLTITDLAILEIVRSEKKRKMENVAESASNVLLHQPVSADHVRQESWKEETQDKSEGKGSLRTAMWLLIEVYFISPWCSLNIAA